MKKLLACACTCTIAFHVAVAQVTTFENAFGYSNGNGEWADIGAHVFVLSDSSYLIFSQSLGFQAQQEKVVLTKFSKEDILDSEVSYGRDLTYFVLGNAGSAVKTFNGEFAIGGDAGINLVDSWGTLWLFNSSLDSVLEKDYGTIGNSDTLEKFGAVTQLPDSGFVLVGWSGTNADSFPMSQWNADVYLARTDAFGNLEWQKKFDRSPDDNALNIDLFDSNHLIIAGYKHTLTATVDTPWVFVTDLEGNITKEKSFTDPPYNCWELIGPRLFKSIDQNFFFVGCLNGALQNGYFDYPIYLAKMDTALNFVWERDFNTANLIYIYNAHQNQDSSIMIVGDQQDSITGRVWGWVSKLDNEGNVIWDKLYKHGNSFSNYLYSIEQTYDCGFVVSGNTIAQNNQQSWLLKMDRFGCINPVCDTLPGSCGLGIPTHSNNEWQSVNTLQLDASIYPNPASEVVNIFYNLPQGTNAAQLIILDVNGRKAFEQKLWRSSHDLEIDVSTFATGMYICKIETANSQLTKKIMIGR